MRISSICYPPPKFNNEYFCCIVNFEILTRVKLLKKAFIDFKITNLIYNLRTANLDYTNIIWKV